MALSPWLSYIRLRNAQDIESVELMLDGRRYPITKQGRGFFSQDFDNPLMFPTEKLSLYVGRKTSRFGFSSQILSEFISISSIEILSRFRGERVQKKGGKVSITLGVLSVTFGVLLKTRPLLRIEGMPFVDSKPVLNTGGMLPVDSVMQPTMKELRRICPRIRILVVGKSGVGKSTLINRIFGVATANVSKDRPGEADIEKEFTSPQNERLILHDSKGFEPGDGGNYDTVKSFIEKRKKMPDVKDQLHAVWLCFQIPISTYGERLLEDAAEAFLTIGKEVLGNIPTIIVFTKYDRLVTFMRQKRPGDPEAGQRYMQESCIQPIQDFTGDKNITNVTVSSKPKYEQSLRDLLTLTQDMISMSSTSPENLVLAALLAAAGAPRMSPKLKVDLSIEVGKHRYWRMLGASADFPGHTIQECLHVIHTDIVLVWNFNDPYEYLHSKEFRRFMMNMVEKVDAPVSRSDTFSEGLPLISPAPVILPLDNFITCGEWVDAAYQKTQSVPTKFMAYIVDLTHVLGILFSLTASTRAKALTRTAIKLACMAYYESEWMTDTHTKIRHFEDSRTTPDAILEKVISMISSDDREVQVSRAVERMPGVDLARDEEWTAS